MTEPLFHTSDLRRTIENQGQKLAQEINSLKESEVLNTSQEDMVKYLTEKWRIDPLEINESEIQMDYGDAQIDVSGDTRRFIFDRSGPFYITGTQVTFYVPFTGDSGLLKCQPSTYSLNPPRATVRENELVFTYEETNEQTAQIKADFERELNQTQVHAERVNADVMKFNEALTGNAVQRLQSRREKLLQGQESCGKHRFPASTDKPAATDVHYTGRQKAYYPSQA